MSLPRVLAPGAQSSDRPGKPGLGGGESGACPLKGKVCPGRGPRAPLKQTQLQRTLRATSLGFCPFTPLDPFTGTSPARRSFGSKSSREAVPGVPGTSEFFRL